MSNAIITSRIVAESERLAFLPRKIPRYYIQFENAIYDVADHIINGYRGGYWEFIELSNGGFYLKPTLNTHKVEIDIWTNGYNGIVSEHAAGIVTTIFSLNYLLSEVQEETLYKHYNSLIDYAYIHEERQQICAAID